MIYAVVFLLLFAGAYVTKRRFGLLGLALAAGSLLSSIWGYNAGLIASGLGVPSNALSVATISSLIVLSPAVVLLFHGYTYKLLVSRVIGSAMFAILAVAFLVEPLGHVLVLQGAGASIYQLVVDSRSAIIGIGLIIAVIDLFLTKPVRDKKSKH